MDTKRKILLGVLLITAFASAPFVALAVNAIPWLSNDNGVTIYTPASVTKATINGNFTLTGTQSWGTLSTFDGNILRDSSSIQVLRVNTRTLSDTGGICILAGSSRSLCDSLGNGLMYFSTNVGIATDTPYSMLAVAGQIVAQNYIATSTTATSTISGLLSVATTTATTTAHLTLDGSLYITSPNGSITIGDTSGDSRGTTALDIQSLRTSSVQVAHGTRDVAIGLKNSATSTSNENVAIGIGNLVGGRGSNSAFGQSNQVYANNSGIFGLSTAVGVANIIGANTFQSTAVGGGNTISDGGGSVTTVGTNNIVSGSGSVAIGVSLTITGSSATSIGRSTSNALNSSVMIGSSDSTKLTVLSTGAIGTNGSTTPWATLAVNPTAGGASNQFVVGSSTATNFIVTNSGFVGVGTTSPYNPLAVTGTSSAQTFDAYGTATSTFNRGISIAGGCFAIGTTCISGSGSGGSGTINSGTTNRLSYYSGVTTLDSANYLNVDATNFRLALSSSTPFGQFSINTTAGTSSLVVGSSTGTYLIVDKNGKVGIGTASPSQALSVSGSIFATSNIFIGTNAQIDTGQGFIAQTNNASALTGGTFQNTNGSGYEGFNFYNDLGTLVTTLGHSNGSTGFLQNSTWFGSRNAEPLYMMTNNAAQVTIDSTGKMGVGTSTPLTKFQVSSGANATTTSTFGEIGDTTSKACFNTKNTAGAGISFYFVGTTIVIENNLCK